MPFTKQELMDDIISNFLEIQDHSSAIDCFTGNNEYGLILEHLSGQKYKLTIEELDEENSSL